MPFEISPHPTVETLLSARRRFGTEAVSGVVQTPRYRLRYWVWGDGPPIIFVHGMIDTTRSFCMQMRGMVDAGFRCIGYELANGGPDGANLGVYRQHHYAEDLIALLDHLQLPRVDIQGSSFGSTVALSALARFPDRFRRAVLQGGFARRPLIRIERGLARLGRYWPWTMSQLVLRPQVMRRLEGGQFTGCPPEIFEFLLECSGTNPIRAASRRALILDKLDLRPLLPGIRHPILMIGGDRDGLVPRSAEAEVETGCPNARRIEFSPCGHYPQYTMPDPMTAAMVPFLRVLRGSSANSRRLSDPAGVD